MGPGEGRQQGRRLVLPEVPLRVGAERAPGFFRGDPLNMRSIPPESTSPTGSALQPVAVPGLPPPAWRASLGSQTFTAQRCCGARREEVLPQTSISASVLTLAVRKADTGPFRICSES